MPAPVSSTTFVERLLTGDLIALGEMGAERNLVKACLAPVGVLANLGMMVGGGKGPYDFGVSLACLRGKGEP